MAEWVSAAAGCRRRRRPARFLTALRRAGSPIAPAPAPSIELGLGLALALRGSATLHSAVKLPMRPLALAVPASAHRSAPGSPALARTRDRRRSGAPWAKPHRITTSGPSRVPCRNVHERQRTMLTRPCHGQLTSQPASTAIRAGAAPDLTFIGDPTAECGTASSTWRAGHRAERPVLEGSLFPAIEQTARFAASCRTSLWLQAARHWHALVRASIVWELQMGGR